MALKQHVTFLMAQGIKPQHHSSTTINPGGWMPSKYAAMLPLAGVSYFALCAMLFRVLCCAAGHHAVLKGVCLFVVSRLIQPKSTTPDTGCP
jgi:hypothetical protein